MQSTNLPSPHFDNGSSHHLPHESHPVLRTLITILFIVLVSLFIMWLCLPVLLTLGERRERRNATAGTVSATGTAACGNGSGTGHQDADVELGVVNSPPAYVEGDPRIPKIVLGA